MYQALYRKYRPKTFSEVVGQSHITDTLQRQVAESRVGHAYLFTGTRGTGKTTCARILAKAVNCEHPVDGAPCCQCDSCRGIDAGTLLDVTELDAASNGSVNDARTLREEAVYPPSVLKKRVYIIDEVHMLSRDAFNALLKIMEEPPEHLLFILATTELQKVPATILSRCQRFSFKRILPRDMEQQLLKIAEAEHIDLTADGAEILARMANGALRDALSLLDQCRTVEGGIDSHAVLDTLGLAGGTQTLQMMRCLVARNAADALALFDKLYRGGKDVAALLGELSDLARDMTVLKAAPEGGEIYQYIYDAELADSNSELIPDGGAVINDFPVTTRAGVINACETYDGYVRFFSRRIPDADIHVTLTLMGKGGDSNAPGNVSIGQGLKRDESGAIAVSIGEGLEFDSADALTVRKDTVMTSDDLLNEEETKQEIAEMLK